MDIKALSTFFQLMLIYLKLTEQISWHWMTVLIPLFIVVGGAVIEIMVHGTDGRTSEKGQGGENE